MKTEQSIVENKGTRSATATKRSKRWIHSVMRHDVAIGALHSRIDEVRADLFGEYSDYYDDFEVFQLVMLTYGSEAMAKSRGDHIKGSHLAIDLALAGGPAAFARRLDDEGKL